MKGLRSIDIRILSCFAQNAAGVNISTLSKTLNLTAQNVYSHLKKLERKGYAKVINHFWFATPLGLVEVKDSLHSTLSSQPSKRIFMGLIYQHKAPLAPTRPVELLEETKEMPFHAVGLHNNNQAFIKVKLTTRVTNRTITIYSKDFYYKRGQLSIEQEAMLKSQLDAYARELEKRLELDLKEVKKDVLYSHVLQEEIADEHHPLALATPKKQSKIVLARLPEDMKERLIADMSKGFKELEAVHASHAGEDSDTIDSQFNALLDGKLSLHDINRLKGIVYSQEERYARQMNIVDRLTRQIDLHLKVMEKIDKKLSQRRLFE